MTSLELWGDPNVQADDFLTSSNVGYITGILPNLREINVSHAGTFGLDLCTLAGLYCQSLSCVKWTGCNVNVCDLSWTSFRTTECDLDLTELYLDDSRIVSPNEAMFNANMTDQVNYLWRHCPRLERLSMKNATYLPHSYPYQQDPQPLSQDMLIKLVRFHPTLRWLRCDLTNENIAMLKEERPQVTVINE